MNLTCTHWSQNEYGAGRRVELQGPVLKVVMTS